MSNDMTCKTCGGRGYLNPEAVTCPDCKGTGKQPKPTSPVTSIRAGDEMIQADSSASEKVCDHPSSEDHRQAASMFLCWPTNAIDLAQNDSDLPELVEKLARFIANRERIALRAAPPAGQVIANPANSLRSLPESSEPSLLGRTGGEIIGYCGWHPDRGYNFSTMAETVQGATSLMLRTGLASGNHRWEILPLYDAASPSLLGRETVREALELAERIKILPAYTGKEMEARLYRVDLGDKTATDDKSVILIGAERRDLLIRALASLSPLKD